MASAPLSHLVPPAARGERFDRHLATAFPQLSRSRLAALIDEGAATVDGRRAKAALRLKGGERIELVVPDPEPTEVAAQELPLSVLYEDSDLLVLDKAAGMVVHPAAGNRDGTLVNALLHRVKDLSGVGGERRPGIVHRLDKDTSGCLVVAKHDRALAGLQAAFKSRQVEKLYLAIVHGAPKQDAGTFRTVHRRHPVHRQRFTGKGNTGKLAVTHYRVLARAEAASLIEVRLETGRTHQIRMHFAEGGNPLLSDALYGGGKKRPANEVIDRQALHAWKLGFAHPRTGKALEFVAPLPPDLCAALKHLGLPEL